MTRFDILLTLSISHPYYSASSEDFAFIVTSETRQQLQNRKIIAKVRAGKLYLLSERDDAGVPLVPATGQTVRIGLKLINPHFGNFTELDFTPGSLIRLYRNSVSPNALDAPQNVQIAGNIISHVLTTSARPITVTLFQSPSQVLASTTITAAHDRPSLAFELTNDPSGNYFVKEEFGNTTITSYYREPGLLGEGVFGAVEILVADSFSTAPPNFTISFSARQETLKYYVVSRNANIDVNQLEVSDQGFTEEQRPEILFTRVAAANFTPAEVPAALFGNGTTKVVLFKSQAAVARREKARKKIELKRPGKVLVQHLPQPAADQTTADMIIHLSKP